MDWRDADVLSCIFVLTLLTLIGFVPYASLREAQVLQPELNKHCGTTYTVAELFWAGDSLQELCKMREQRLTIKGDQ